ncbi:hypothetical protein JMJ35_005664 [Cladonia borealis]|uniref:J domain-containing protein n=1 Tax=Cladonia borealis TaxID=184061 RepID=A0AA39V4W3_9LECA|nr:hypothetical protein JMJ35_005664 [Cladonia borealis]
MSTDYNYDEQGQFFPYFILTISALVTLPLSYTLLRPNKDIEDTAPRIKSDFKPLDDALIQGQKRKQWRRERRLKRILTVAAGWLTIALMIYLIAVTKTTAPKIWDPYSILEISRSSTEQQIKKRYRDLSRIYHPDKAIVDESKNQTAEDINDYWVEVTKAFKTLTDEEIRNNYIQYGHPDGKQSFSIGIALPKFIVTDGNGKYVLLVYGLLLGVLLPYVVGKWWYGTQKLTKEKVLLASASNLFREYKEDMKDGDVVNALSSGEEYKDVFGANKMDSGLGKIEKSIVQEDEARTIVTQKDHQKLESYDGARRKAAALIWAYLGRIRLDGASLDDEKFETAPLALRLNESFIAIALAYGNIPQLLSAYRISQHLIQAVPPNASPLLQLPHITPQIAKAIEGQSSRKHLTVQGFMAMPEYRRRKLATDQPGVLSPGQYNEAVAVARQLPLLNVEKVFFKVMGERFITTGSLVQFVVKARVIPPGSANVPAVNELDLEDIDPDEGDLDAILGRKSPQNAKAKTQKKPLQPPLAYAPYFPRDHSPRWHVFLSDSKLNKVAVPPFTMTTFNKPLLDDDGNPTFNMQTFKMQFQAPPQAGSYPFVMHLICDSYIGMDSKREVVLKVEDSAKAISMDNEEDEISEPDEDSLAGQMHALKTGGVASLAAPPKRPRTRPAKIADSSDDDESDTEGEAEDTSETDTDTDSEDERVKEKAKGKGKGKK